MSKYDWSNVHPDVKWIATDGYSNWAWGFQKQEPFIDEDMWNSKLEYDHVDVEKLYGVSPYQGDWRESLEKRPCLDQ
jgi:hypothetical protein